MKLRFFSHFLHDEMFGEGAAVGPFNHRPLSTSLLLRFVRRAPVDFERHPTHWSLLVLPIQLAWPLLAEFAVWQLQRLPWHPFDRVRWLPVQRWRALYRRHPKIPNLKFFDIQFRVFGHSLEFTYVFDDVIGICDTFTNILWTMQLAFSSTTATSNFYRWTRRHHIVGGLSRYLQWNQSVQIDDFTGWTSDLNFTCNK